MSLDSITEHQLPIKNGECSFSSGLVSCGLMCRVVVCCVSVKFLRSFGGRQSTLAVGEHNEARFNMRSVLEAGLLGDLNDFQKWDMLSLWQISAHCLNSCEPPAGK